MSKYKKKSFANRSIKTYSLLSRKSKVNIKDFAQAFTPAKSFDRFMNSIPEIQAGKEFKEFVSLTRQAREKGKSIIFAMGSHVIKVGLSPVIIDLMENGWITALAMNGSGIIHDFEIAFSGSTSEYVEDQIRDGQFGMAHETGEMLNDAICSGREAELGLGEAVGRMISDSSFPHKDLSLLSVAYRLNIPVTVHVAIGTDTIHFHPNADGGAIGETSLRDFYLFCSLLEDLEGGGVYINAGSAVLLPEVFLKGVSLLRNRGVILEDFTTAVFDFMMHYRPFQNVVKRPLGKNGRGFYFIGHHEIMIPFLAALLKCGSIQQ
jgi:hypothetical protein